MRTASGVKGIMWTGKGQQFGSVKEIYDLSVDMAHRMTNWRS